MEQGFWALFLFLGMAEPCLGFVEEMILDLGSSPPSQIVQPFDEFLSHQHLSSDYAYGWWQAAKPHFYLVKA